MAPWDNDIAAEKRVHCEMCLQTGAPKNTVHLHGGTSPAGGVSVLE